jgi:hypothetical protein
VVKKGQKPTELIQVSWDVMGGATRRREERALQCDMEELSVNSGIILTEDEETNVEINGNVIKYMPIWKWLLNPPEDMS